MSAHFDAALTAWRADDLATAHACLTRHFESGGNDPTSRHLWGVVLLDMGQVEGAIAALSGLSAQLPDDGSVAASLGSALLAAGRLDEARSSLEQAMRLVADDGWAHLNLGRIYFRQRALLQAVEQAEHAVRLEPDLLDAWMLLGRARYALSHHGQAAQAFSRAAETPGAHQLDALKLAGLALADAGQPSEAAQSLQRFLDAGGTPDLGILSQLLYCRLELADWCAYEALRDQCLHEIGAGATPIEPFTSLLVDGVDIESQQLLTQRFTASFLANKPSGGTPLHAPEIIRAVPETKLRVGYLGDVFRTHPTAQLAVAAIEQQSRDRYEIHGFSYGAPETSPMSTRMQDACDEFHDLHCASDDEFVARIRAAGIDLLIDLNGWSGNTRSALLATGLAPVQINWLGYPGTIGDQRHAQYLIGDSTVTPAEHVPYYAESLAWMPHCYQPNDSCFPNDNRATRESEGLPASALVFCCFNRVLKISPHTFSHWCHILRAVPDSVLWLLAASQQAMDNLRGAMAGHGIDPERLLFAAMCPQHQHLARLRLADVFLDTLPYNAHTTASDALRCGVPVVTLLGTPFQSRVATSLLRNVGLAELSASNADDYCRIAIDLGTNVTKRTAARRALHDALRTSALFDPARFARDLDELLQTIWRHATSHDGKAVRPLQTAARRK